MDKMTNIPGLKKLWSETRGDPKICVAVLDGIVDQNHPCFDGAVGRYGTKRIRKNKN
jgi:hypothetical protein